MTAVSAEDRLWELLRGALETRALALATADLGVADALADARSVADLAGELDADADTLTADPRALAAEGVFAETEPGVFTNTEASELCVGLGLAPISSAARGFGRRVRSNLRTRVVSAALYGTDFWSAARREPGGTPCIRSCDGAREGATCRAAQRRSTGEATRRSSTSAAETDRCSSSSSSGTPGSAGSSSTSRRPSATSKPRGALHLRGGLRFERVPAGDVYLLARILHNWDDSAAGGYSRRSAPMPHLAAG